MFCFFFLSLVHLLLCAGEWRVALVWTAASMAPLSLQCLRILATSFFQRCSTLGDRLQGFNPIFSFQICWSRLDQTPPWRIRWGKIVRILLIQLSWVFYYYYFNIYGPVCVSVSMLNICLQTCVPAPKDSTCLTFICSFWWGMSDDGWWMRDALFFLGLVTMWRSFNLWIWGWNPWCSCFFPALTLQMMCVFCWRRLRLLQWWSYRQALFCCLARSCSHGGGNPLRHAVTLLPS